MYKQAIVNNLIKLANKQARINRQYKNILLKRAMTANSSFASDMSDIGNAATNVYNGARDAWNKGQAITTGAIRGVKNTASAAYNAAVNAPTNVYNAIGNAWNNTTNAIGNAAHNAWNSTTNAIGNAASNAWNGVTNAASNAWNSATTAAGNAANNAYVGAKKNLLGMFGYK